MLKGRPLMNLFRLKDEGNGIREISRISGHSRNTVRKYVRDGATPNNTARKTRGSKLDPYKDEVRALVKAGLYSVPAIMERIVPAGYEGKETILRDFVRSILPPRSERAPAVARFETEPGEQLQFDWGIFGYIDASGRQRNLPGLVATLSYSRRRFVRFAWSQDIFGLLECIIAAFTYFGGVTSAVLTDHAKTVVLSGDPEGGWNYHPKFLELTNFLGVSIRLCQVRRAQTKGKVERSIRYVKENFWPGRSFGDLVDLNAQALAWCAARDEIENATTGLRPMEAFAVEAPTLRPLPPASELERFLLRPRRVSADALVSFGGTSYGVPFRYAGQMVSVLPGERTISILDSDAELIASHALVFKQRKTVFLPGQYQGLDPKTARRVPPGRAREKEVAVEARSLAVYEERAHG